MSAQIAILMVKNSRSFEVTKIRHYREQPFRRLLKASLGGTPLLPSLSVWRDQRIDIVISKVDTFVADTGNKALGQEQIWHSNLGKNQLKPVTSTSTANGSRRVALTDQLAMQSPVHRPPLRKKLMLGADAARSIHENCNLRDVLAASESLQNEEFHEMISGLAVINADEQLRNVETVLTHMQDNFGENVPDSAQR